MKRAISLALLVVAGCAASGRITVGPPVVPHVAVLEYDVTLSSPMLDAAIATTTGGVVLDDR